MSGTAAAGPRVLAHHARLSLGLSDDAIYRMVAAALAGRDARGELFVDVGCGSGGLWAFVRDRFARYVGLDGIRHDGLPAETDFRPIDLDDAPHLPLDDAVADAVVAVETIEHLENPRALMRELARVAKPGAWVAVTTPNQRSLLSLVTLAVKGRFSAFQDVHYPAHITALLDVDLYRMGRETRLVNPDVRYTGKGRIPLTGAHFPAALARLFPRALSDNLLFIARKPDGAC